MLSEKEKQDSSKVIKIMQRYHKKYGTPKKTVAEVIDCEVCGAKDSFTILVSSENGHVRGGCKECHVMFIE